MNKITQQGSIDQSQSKESIDNALTHFDNCSVRNIFSLSKAHQDYISKRKTSSNYPTIKTLQNLSIVQLICQEVIMMRAGVKPMGS